MQIGRSPALSQDMHPLGPGRETSLRLTAPGTGAGAHRSPHLPASHAAPFLGSPAPTPPREEEGRGPHPVSASATAARDAGSDGNEVRNSGKSPTWAQRDLQPLGNLQRFPRFRGNSHKTQVICCNIVAGSYSRFAEIGNALGVLGFPQSTAGRRYEISIYILQPGWESDNLKAKLRGERSSLERPVGADGAGGVPWAPGTWWHSTGCSGVPGSTQPLYPEKLLPTHPFCGLTT